MELLIKGGPVMIPLAVCSVIAVTLTLERFLSLSRGRVIPDDFIEDLERHCPDPDDEGAKVYCDRSGSVVGRVFRAAFAKVKSGKEDLTTAVSDTASREVGKMRRSLRGLKVIAAIAPLLGLLGTVSGMIRAFQTVALSSSSLGRAEMLAQGIYEAMVTTATGLAIAIPTLLVFYLLSNRVDGLADDIEAAAERFIDYCLGTRPTPPPTAEAS
ncbi:MAG: MotA/TolQ/ExbB proton channel family protein [Verrucomicrobiota bacterium]